MTDFYYPRDHEDDDESFTAGDDEIPQEFLDQLEELRALANNVTLNRELDRSHVIKKLYEIFGDDLVIP